MINATIKSGQLQVNMQTEREIPIQDELTNMIAGLLLTFRKSVTEANADPALADNDAPIILINALNVYHLESKRIEKENHQNVIDFNPNNGSKWQS